MSKLILLGGVFLLSGYHLAYSQLKWGKTVMNCIAESKVEAIKVNYPFLNAGEKNIEIKSIKTSCGCTSAETDRKIFPSGEKGEICVIFTLGNRHGMQHKVIIVETNDPKNPKTVLLLNVDIQDPGGKS